MPDDRSISDRLVDELSTIIRSRQAELAIRVNDYCQATWHSDPNNVPDTRIAPDQIRDLVELVIEAFDGVSGEIQGAIEIDATLFTRGLDALRRAELEDGAA